jgi:phenylacetate-CoA ligase
MEEQTLNFNPGLSWEFLSADEIAAKTIRALRNHIQYVKESSPYYRETLRDVAPEDLQTLDDILHLPRTDRAVLACATATVAAAPLAIVETVATSGTTGKPIFIGLTGSDLDRLAFSEALSFSAMGISADDRVLLMVNMDGMSLPGLGYYRGLTLLHATIGRAGLPSHQLCRQYLESFRPTVLLGAPSFLRRMTIDLVKNGFRSGESGVMKIVCVGENLRNSDMSMNPPGKKLEEAWDAKVFGSYAITELAGSFADCEERSGGHTHPELLYAEIVDENGSPVPDNTPGELVATTFGTEGMPLVRYRTGDITFRVKGACACGRNSARIGPILGRTDEMLKISGQSIFPLVVTNALDEMDEIGDYIITIDGDNSGDRVNIHVAAQPSAVERIANHVRNAARVSFPILISNVSTIQSMRGAWRRNARIIDERRCASRRA